MYKKRAVRLSSCSFFISRSEIKQLILQKDKLPMVSNKLIGGIILYNDSRNMQHLAWHETMELHELIAFQSNNLMDFKMNIPHVIDPTLQKLYAEAIKGLESNLKELLPYFQIAPVPMRNASRGDLTAFYAAHLLICAKTSVRNYAIAITETTSKGD
jgi:spore coat protein CotF